MPSALVTGATRGIGLAMAKGLVGAGWTVWALGRDRHVLEGLRADLGVLPLALDLTDREEMGALVAGLAPDLLVHAALRFPQARPFLHMPEASVDMALEVNLSAMLHLTRLIGAGMVARRGGAVRIVLPDGQAGLLAQTVAGAARAFSAGLAQEFRHSGVSVELIGPATAAHPTPTQRLLRSLPHDGSGLPRVATGSGAYQ